MKWFFLVILFSFFARLVFAVTGVAIQGGPVIVRGGYMDIGTTVLVSSNSVTERAGTCIGILCGVTYN